MGRQTSSSPSLLPIFIIVLPLLWISHGHGHVSAADEHGKDFYIVFLGDRPSNKDAAVQTHLNLLSSVKLSHDEARESMVYSYTKSFNAFAAKLYPHEAHKLSDKEGVVGVIQNEYYNLHTTRSWDFIGLPLSVKRNLEVERDIIIGVLDTGIIPESDSFKDKGLGPPPAKWKGSCGPYANFTGCNNKLIGAQYFKLDGNPPPDEILSPIDVIGHGTHTASTVAGVTVANASLDGLANGIARGGAPSARVAMYKVCWGTIGCASMDVLAGFDAAIHDGVDIVSISVGMGRHSYLDAIAVGSFHALRKGIITVASAGNDGPGRSTVKNDAPWILTVAASGTDRAFRSQVDLGDGTSISGTGINLLKPKGKQPLVYGAAAAKNSDSKVLARTCAFDSLDPGKVKGKIVLCSGKNGLESTVNRLGGAGTIIARDHPLDRSWIFMAPATLVNKSPGKILDKYMRSTRTPSAMIHKTHEVKISAPFIASFSSRGPTLGAKRLLKPDIAAPGVDILAAFTPLRSLTGLAGDTQFSKFTIASGTSMACPHAAGVVAYVKSFHPEWTAAAIKSAIITSATPMTGSVNDEAEFSYGAGQINPGGAVDPGLVYDMDEMSYIQFLCTEGYTGADLAKLVGQSVDCSSLIPGFGYDSFNYPTMQLRLGSSQEQTVAVFRRTVTNVGPVRSGYNATVTAPEGVEMTVKPSTLLFSEGASKISYEVTIKAGAVEEGKILSGSVVWKSGRHVVRSPIVIFNPKN